MIKYFRKIRYELMNQNKTSKYFKYAIGEIVLVVIGILIALSINNWNENVKIKEEQRNLLEALKVDLLESDKRLKSTMKYQKRVIDNNALLLDILKKEVDVIDHRDSIGQIFNSGLLTFFRAEPVTGTYDAMLGSGKTALIKNEELNRRLAAYSTEIKMGYEDHDYGMILIQLVLDKTANYNGPFLSDRSFRSRKEYTITSEELNYAVKELLNDKDVIGIAFKRNGVERRRYARQNKLVKNTEKLLTIINQELSD